MPYIAIYTGLAEIFKFKMGKKLSLFQIKNCLFFC